FTEVLGVRAHRRFHGEHVLSQRFTGGELVDQREGVGTIRQRGHDRNEWTNRVRCQASRAVQDMTFGIPFRFETMSSDNVASVRRSNGFTSTRQFVSATNDETAAESTSPVQKRMRSRSSGRISLNAACNSMPEKPGIFMSEMTRSYGSPPRMSRS